MTFDAQHNGHVLCNEIAFTVLDEFSSQSMLVVHSKLYSLSIQLSVSARKYGGLALALLCLPHLCHIDIVFKERFMNTYYILKMH